MFSLFSKKKPDLPDVLYFKSNQGAFEYACKYCITTLQNEQPVLGVVLGRGGKDNYCIKLSNDSDPSIPSETPEQLLERGNIKNICFSAAPIDRVPPLAVGDLVLFVAPADLMSLGMGAMVGVIVAKVKPAISVKNGWLFE